MSGVTVTISSRGVKQLRMNMTAPPLSQSIDYQDDTLFSPSGRKSFLRMEGRGGDARKRKGRRKTNNQTGGIPPHFPFCLRWTGVLRLFRYSALLRKDLYNPHKIPQCIVNPETNQASVFLAISTLAGQKVGKTGIRSCQGHGRK